MKKLVQICVEGNRGSTGRIAESIGIQAIQDGWESYIAYGRFKRPSKSKIIKIGNSFDHIFHGILTRLFDMHCLGSKRATKVLVKKLNEIKPDIIQLHHLHGYYVNIEILFEYLKNNDINVVWTFHDFWTITGHCTYFSAINCDKWKTQCYNCPQKKEYPTSYFIDQSKKNFDIKKKIFTSIDKMTIVCVSNWVKDISKMSFLKNKDFRVIYNGIDINIFNPIVKDLNLKNKYKAECSFMILGVANTWSKTKGLDDFLKLSKLIRPDEKILLVGLNSKQIKTLPHNIIGISQTDNQEQLKDLYATADVFINFSTQETFGLTTVEALACGTPAIVYNLTACPEIVDDNTGFIVESGNFVEVIKALDLIRRNKKEFYKTACRKRVVDFFNMENRFKEYISLYNEKIIE